MGCSADYCGPETKIPEKTVESTFQELYVTSQQKLEVTRDSVSVNVAHAPATVQAATLTSTHLAPNGSLLGAAYNYIGMGWDCTMLIEQSLRDLGYSVGDLGPTDFGMFGAVFTDPSQVQPGDIMMRGGHAAIYVGDGVAIHGGYNGRVAIVATSPSQFYSFVRL